MLRWVLAALLLFCSTVKAYMLPGALARGHTASSHPVDFGPARACLCMGCRNNLKKDKRLRNRINAFRFKKGGNTGFSRFAGPDKGAMKLKEESDAEFMALVFNQAEGAEQ